MLPLRGKVDLGVMAIRGYYTFSRAPLTGALPSDSLVSCLVHSLEKSYPSAELQSMYFTGLVLKFG